MQIRPKFPVNCWLLCQLTRHPVFGRKACLHLHIYLTWKQTSGVVTKAERFDEPMLALQLLLPLLLDLCALLSMLWLPPLSAKLRITTPDSSNWKSEVNLDCQTGSPCFSTEEQNNLLHVRKLGKYFFTYVCQTERLIQNLKYQRNIQVFSKVVAPTAEPWNTRKNSSTKWDHHRNHSYCRSELNAKP